MRSVVTVSLIPRPVYTLSERAVRMLRRVTCQTAVTQPATPQTTTQTVVAEEVIGTMYGQSKVRI